MSTALLPRAALTECLELSQVFDLETCDDKIQNCFLVVTDSVYLFEWHVVETCKHENNTATSLFSITLFMFLKTRTRRTQNWTIQLWRDTAGSTSRKQPTLVDLLQNAHRHISEHDELSIDQKLIWPCLSVSNLPQVPNCNLSSSRTIQNNNFRVRETTMNHHRVPITANKLYMYASLTQCSDMKYVHVRVTNAYSWWCQDVSHRDIKAVEVLVDSSSERPSSATPWRCVLRKRLL